MTDEQARFFEWLDENLAYLNNLFDKKECQYKVESVDDFLSVASHGEAIMAQFVLGVWLHRNLYEFDLFEAMTTLDDKNINIIKEWIEEPFWP